MKKRFFSILLALALCLTLLPTAALATDTSGHWAEETIAEWQQKGYVSGYGDGTFRPDSSITRAEFVKLLNRVLGLTAEAAISFTDVKESDWFYAEVAKAAAAGYAKGDTDGAFHPNAPITRAEAAVMLTRALALTVNEARAEEFADASAISKWAKGSIGAVADAGYMTGYPDGAFGAKDSITRAQAVVTLDRVQNVTVTADGTVLTDKTVAGDLTIAESVGEGEVTLKKVTVEGDLIIRGGGANSVYLDGVTVLGEVRLEKENLHLRLLGGTKLGTVRVLAKVKLSGSGTIESLIVSVNGVTMDRDLTIRKTETVGGAKAPTVYNPGSSGSSGSGSAAASIAVTGAAAVSPVTVDNGTSEAAAMSKLPVSVMLNCADGSTVSANVAWVLDKPYDVTDEAGSTYHATGTVTIPGGYTYNGTLTVQTTLTVSPIVREILGVVTVPPVEVNYATDEASAMGMLPATVTLNVQVNKVSSTTAAEVTWVLDKTYDAKPDSNTAYKANGTVTIPAGYTYNGTLTAETTLTVLANKAKVIQNIVAPTGEIEVDNGTDETDAMEQLPSEVRLETYSPGTMLFAAVTWARKSGETYNAAPTARTSVTYVGTVTIPDGYKWNGKATIEANIVVLPSGEQATKKKVRNSSYAADVYVDRYTEIMSEIEKSLPEQIRMQCEDDSWITVTVDKSKWQKVGQADDSGYIKYSFNYKYQDIRLPTGYEFTSTQNIVNVGISVKVRDIEALQTALDAAREQLNRKAYTEVEALSSPEKVYFVNDDTEASNIAAGVKFVYESEIKQAEETLSNLTSGTYEASNLCTVKQLDNQDKIDAAAKALNKAAAAFKDALDQNAKPGTGYTQANILANIKKWLDENESNSNYAYSKSMQPLTVEMHGTNCISLPQIATDIKINVAEEKANVYLEWSIGDPNYAYAELKTENNQQYVWLNGKNDVPRDLSLTVKATTYQDANGNTVTLNEQVEAYNNLIVGAPITRYPNTSGNTYVDVDELISGKKQTFWIRIPLRYNSEKIESIDVKQATAQCSDGSLTGDIAVDSVLSDALDQRGLYTVLQAQLTATAKQLDAVVDTDKPKTAKVTLTIPYGAVTLTDWAIKQGWYIPQDGLKLEAEVKIHHPLVEITKAAPDGETEVTVDFNTEYWGDSYRAVWMALVPENVTNFTGSETGCFKSEYGTGISGDWKSDITIPVSGIQADTTYRVWVKVGDDGNWMKSDTAYTHTTGN